MLAGTFGYNVTNTTTSPVMVVFTKYSWDQFWTVADEVFNPPNTQNNTALNLDQLQQGRLSAEEFFIEFNMLARIAGYDDVQFDLLKIRLANQRLNKSLVANIHNTTTLPKTWEDYRARAVALDNNWRIGRASRPANALNISNSAPRPQQLNNPFRQQQRRDPNAMEVDATHVTVAFTPQPCKRMTSQSTQRIEGD